MGATICFLWLHKVIVKQLPSVVPSQLVIPASREERHLAVSWETEAGQWMSCTEVRYYTKVR